ncbi:hypothetical protein AVEN_7649-1 [Araneus ventricosus]|uniref:C2H2-type domain-containing protein n=1 Tax=Araneus ventricosus TaxID=182803 RepID=A0A4Y2T0I4_ARAVE|nr:hypothetical protein AVEN_7649-1 [Araneus ventricosus]
MEIPPSPVPVSSSYPNFSLGVVFPPTPAPFGTSGINNLPPSTPAEHASTVNPVNANQSIVSRDASGHSAAGTSNTSPTSKQKTKVIKKQPIKCDVPGCSEIRKTKKGMHLHKLYKHKIPIQKPEHPGSSQISQDPSVDNPPPPSIQADTDQNLQTANNVDNSQIPSPLTCPAYSQRVGNSLDFLFPIANPMPCTEPDCVFFSVGCNWNRIKCSMLRHLKATHLFQKIKSRHWCATCGQRIKKPKSHPCLALGTTINTECKFKCEYPDCGFSSPTELGLRNHTNAHRKSDALAAAVQRKIPNIVQSRKRTKRLRVSEFWFYGARARLGHAAPLKWLKRTNVIKFSSKLRILKI